MPENGSVNSGGGASSSSSATSSSSSSSESSSSNESQTTEESITSEPTTEETLSGADENSKSDDSGKSSESNNNTETHTNGNSDSDNDRDNNNGKSNNAAANDSINNVADSGKDDFNNRTGNAVGSSVLDNPSDLTGATSGYEALNTDTAEESDLPPPPPTESDIPNPADFNNANTNTEPSEKSLSETALDAAEAANDAISDASRVAGEAITGFLEAGLETGIDAVNLAAGTVNTGLDVVVGPVVDGVEALTGLEAPSVLPDAQRGYENYNKAAASLETMVTNPVSVIEATVEPVKSEWNAGNKAEAVGRAAFELGGLVMGGAGALGKIPGSKQADLAPVDSAGTRQTGGGSQSGPADEMYETIRASETDVKSISENTGFKEENIQKVKDHVFNEEHKLDRFVEQGEPVEIKRFDSDVNQAEAWNRLEEGTHTPEDITWMKHETAESWYEKKHDSGYNEAHNKAQERWDGKPWGNE